MQHRTTSHLGLTWVLVSVGGVLLATGLTSCASDCTPPHTLQPQELVGNAVSSANDFNPSVHRYSRVEFTIHYLISEDVGPSFQWPTIPPGAKIVGTPGASSVAIRLADKGGPLCVQAKSECGDSNALCKDLVIDPQPWWTALDEFPGGDRMHMSPSFTVGNKAYVGAGTSKALSGHKDWWEFDFGTFVWTRKQDIPDVGVVGGGAGGVFQGFLLGTRIFLVTNEGHLWEYVPGSDAWQPRANYPGTLADSARFFGAGGLGVGGLPAWPSFAPIREVWTYDPGTNKWTKRADFAGPESGIPQGGIGFQIGERGFLGWGEDKFHQKHKVIWEYVPATDQWSTVASVGFVTTDYLTTFQGRALFAVDGGIKAWSPAAGEGKFLSHPFLGELPGCFANDKFVVEVGGTQGQPSTNGFVFLFNE